jgi:hypothetical protein
MRAVRDHQTPDRRAEADLIWFWAWSDGEMGLRSSFGAMTARLQVGGRTGGRPITDLDERCIEAATRARLISRALELLPGLHRRALRYAYGPDARELPGLGVAAPVALLSPAAMLAYRESRSDRPLEEWLVRLCWRAHRRQGESPARDRCTVRAIALEANATLARAVQAFASARRSMPSRRSCP